MSDNPRIKRVVNNKSKGKTYSNLIKKYNEAMEQGYYGEAELIVYAFLEDRLMAFLYHCDLIDNRNTLKTNHNAELFYGEGKSIKDITAKIELIKKLSAACGNSDFKDDEYIRYIKKVFIYSINRTELRANLTKIKNWCRYRNEIVHSMFNKDIDALHDGYEEHVREGYQLARYVDNQVAAIKKT